MATTYSEWSVTTEGAENFGKRDCSKSFRYGITADITWEDESNQCCIEYKDFNIPLGFENLWCTPLNDKGNALPEYIIDYIESTVQSWAEKEGY